MTDLTLEELAALDALRVESVGSGGHYMLGGGAADQRYMRALLPATERLIAMARELVRLRSALGFIDYRGVSLVPPGPHMWRMSLSTDAVATCARELGWIDPTKVEG